MKYNQYEIKTFLIEVPDRIMNESEYITQKANSIIHEQIIWHAHK